MKMNQRAAFRPPILALVLAAAAHSISYAP